MAFKRLSTLNLHNEIKEKIVKANLKTVEDALSMTPLELMNILRISSYECDSFRNQLFTLCLPKKYTASEILLHEEAGCLPYGYPLLDSLLQGGLQMGTMSELAGPAGVGKTQFCISIAVQCVHSSFPSHSVIYIDTESAFRPERVLEILQVKESDIKKAKESLSKIFVYQPFSISSLSNILDSLEMVIIEKSVKLVIVDSIASLARKEMSSSASSFSRAEVLARWAALLKSVAHKMSIAILLTNQVTTRISHEDGHETNGSYSNAVTKPVPSQIIPALGATWTHFVNSRFILQYTDGVHRQFLIAKSPVSPVASFNYIITESGIEFQGKGTYTSKGLDFSKHGLKVHRGILLNS